MRSPILPVLYVAGAFRGDSAWRVENNIRAAEALALHIWQLGAVALCPHTNTRFFQGAAPDEVWLAGDLELLRRADGIVMVSNWLYSTGARAEHDHARELGLPIFYQAEGAQKVKEWIDGWKTDRSIKRWPLEAPNATEAGD